MIVIVEPYNAEKHVYLLEQMFWLRAQIFRDCLAWDVVVKDGKERDKYDDENPVYVIYTDERCHKLKGSLRLLPTTGHPISEAIVSRIKKRLKGARSVLAAAREVAA